MNSILARGAMTVIALSIAGISQAVPIRFQFSGNTYDGTRASGQFFIETAGLRQLDTPPTVPQKTFTDLLGLNDRPVPMLGSFSVGGTTYDMGSYLPGGYGGISFVDVCTPVCFPNTRENWNISLYQQDYPFGGAFPASGIYTFQSMSFLSGTPYSFEHTESFDFLDNNITRPEDILTLPLLQMTGVFYEETVTCVAGACSSTRNFEYQINVDTVSRSVVSTSVPEPGTLALLGAALAGMFFVRRRRAAEFSPAVASRG